MDEGKEVLLSSVYLSLGSNLGDRLGHLRQAVISLSSLGKLGKSSAVYESEAWGYQDERAYLNMALEIHTSLEPEVLYEQIREVEKAQGRIQKSQDSVYAARELDIDILFYDQCIIDTENLTIPHPRLELRKFVLLPMVDVAPLLLHPVSGKTMSALLGETPDSSHISHYADGL